MKIRIVYPNHITMATSNIGVLHLKNASATDLTEYIQYITALTGMGLHKFLDKKGAADVYYLYSDASNIDFKVSMESVVFYSNKIHYGLSSKVHILSSDSIKNLLDRLGIDYMDEHIEGMFVHAGSNWLRDIVKTYAYYESDKNSFCLPMLGWAGPENEKQNLDVKLLDSRVSDTMFVRTLQITKQHWIHVCAGEVFEIPTGILSMKVSLGADFIVSDDRNNVLNYVESTGPVYNKIFGNIKPWFNVSVKNYRRFIANNSFYIKLSTSDQKLLNKISKRTTLIPLTAYTVYKLTDDKYERIEVTTNKLGRFDEKYIGHSVVIP